MTLSVPAGVAENGAGDPNTASNEVTAFFNANAPSVEIIGAPAAFNEITPFDVTVRFSTPVIFFDFNRLNITNATVTGPPSDFTPTEDFMITITPTNTGDITIAVPTFTAYSQPGFSPNIPSAVVTILSDMTRPTVALSSSTTTAVGTTPFTVTATFSEDVTGFSDILSDVTVTNGTTTSITQDTPSTYTIKITPDGTGEVTIRVPEDAAVDGAQNGNLPSSPASVAQADSEAPSVTVSGAPTNFSGTTPFTLDVTFNEDVSGFDDIAGDLTVTNGAATSITQNTPAQYTVEITPDNSGDVTIQVPAGAAEDTASNGSTVSNAVTVSSTRVEITQKAISDFMASRANALASNQAGLTHFLRDRSCNAFNANASEGGGSASGCISSSNSWAALAASWSDNTSYTLLTLGAHQTITPDLLIGGMLQLDSMRQEANSASGDGWLLGPYFVAKSATQPLFFEGRLLYGQTDNTISIGDEVDNFDTERWLAQLQVSGEIAIEETKLNPLFDLSWTSDKQQAYTTTSGQLIPRQKIQLTQLTAGMDFDTPLPAASGSLSLNGGLRGIYSSVTNATTDYEGLRARVSAGSTYRMPAGAMLSMSTFYDGIGTDYESFGANLNFDFKF